MDVAHKLTDKKLAIIEKQIKRIFGQCAKDVKKKADVFFAGFEKRDKKKLEMVKAGTLSQENYDKWRRMEIITGEKYRNLEKNLTATMLNSYEAAISFTNGQLPEVFALNYNYVGHAIEKVANPMNGYTFDMIDAQTVANLASEKSSLLPYKEVDKKKFERWSRSKTNSTILSGILRGDSVQQMAKSLERVVGISKNTSITNARTMVTSAENAGRVDSMRRAEKMGTIVEKQWLAIHDDRTRDWHRELDGITKPLDKPFKNSIGDIRFPGDPEADPANVYNCRCTIAEVVVGFGKVPKNVTLADLYED